MVYYNTVNKLLKDSLLKLMKAQEFSPFRLVGGTALSLQLGHRESVDIDLFSDIEYGSINFKEIEDFLNSNFNYVDFLEIPSAMGKAYFIGENRDNTIKLDVFYTDSYIQSYIEIDSIRMASIEEIIAMKVDVIQRGGRKKDFWDLHYLLDTYNIKQMIAFHEQRYPYTHDKDLIVRNFTNFNLADDDFDPICYKGKYWEFIKEDFEETIKNNF
jgi:predicted nucleotidyltransferase component of viral defense system